MKTMLWSSAVVGLMALIAVSAVAQPAPQTSPRPATQTPPATVSPRASGPAAEDRYADEPTAKARCGSDPVVWANLESKIWHTAGDRFFGHTKRGAYMCQTVAVRDGLRAAKK